MKMNMDIIREKAAEQALNIEQGDKNKTNSGDKSSKIRSPEKAKGESSG